MSTVEDCQTYLRAGCFPSDPGLQVFEAATKVLRGLSHQQLVQFGYPQLDAGFLPREHREPVGFAILPTMDWLPEELRHELYVALPYHIAKRSASQSWLAHEIRDDDFDSLPVKIRSFIRMLEERVFQVLATYFLVRFGIHLAQVESDLRWLFHHPHSSFPSFAGGTNEDSGDLRVSFSLFDLDKTGLPGQYSGGVYEGKSFGETELRERGMALRRSSTHQIYGRLRSGDLLVYSTKKTRRFIHPDIPFTRTVPSSGVGSYAHLVGYDFSFASAPPTTSR